LPGVFDRQSLTTQQLLQALIPTIATAITGLAGWAAFVIFGKRRRDNGEPGSQPALAAVGFEADAAPGLRVVDESFIPRWRRPSLQQVRKTDPLRAVAQAPTLSFEAAGIRPLENFERRTIGYRLVRLLDSPDEVRSQEMGVLDQGDEVQLLQRQGVYWFVLCPDGRQGWVHRMVLADRPVANAEQSEREPIDSVVASEAARPIDSLEEPGTSGLLEAYIKARGEVLRTLSDVQPVVEAPAEAAVAADRTELDASAASPTAVEQPSAEQAPAAKPGHAGERYSGRKREGTRKASTASRPGAKSRRPSR
jgi:hypothetical protein